jgi:hypothetical protein
MLITIAIIIAAFAGFALGFRASAQRLPQLVAQNQRSTLDILVRGGDTLDLILAEAEKRQAAKASTGE